jgi:hypothetical protein
MLHKRYEYRTEQVLFPEKSEQANKTSAKVGLLTLPEK